MKTKLLILAAIAVMAAMATASAFAVSSQSPEPSGPTAVSEIPSTLPAAGITIDPVANILVMPAAAGEQAQVAVSTADEAIAAAPKIPTPLAPTAVFGRVTIGATVPPVGLSSKGYADVENRLAWVITYTYPEPVNVRIGGSAPSDTNPTKPSPLLKSHANIIIDAQSGAFLLGFFTE